MVEHLSDYMSRVKGDLKLNSKHTSMVTTHVEQVLKVNPYAKYMKDIITNKRKIPEAEISTMLAIHL